MTDDTLFPFDLPAVRRKKVRAAFDGGLVLLREADRRLGLAETLAGCIRDRRDPALITHTLAEMMRFRMFAIACGYEDGDDCDSLRAGLCSSLRWDKRRKAATTCARSRP